MTNLFFLPFVGHDYSAGGIFGKRVMILGESHYCGEKCADCGVAGKAGDCAAFTTNVIKAYLNPNTERERWMSTYLKDTRPTGMSGNAYGSRSCSSTSCKWRWTRHDKRVRRNNIFRRKGLSMRCWTNTCPNISSYGARGFGAFCPVTGDGEKRRTS